MPISIKGIIVGMLFGFVMSLVLGLVMGFALAAMSGAESATDFLGTTESGRMTALLLFIDAIISVAAGYVAARVAGRGELVNAVLSNLLGAAIGMFIAMLLTPDALVDGLIELALLPLFGLLGGYMRLRQVTEFA